MIVHKLSIKVFWGFVVHRLDAMGGAVEAAPVGDAYGPWLERTVLADAAPPTLPVPLADQPTLWVPLRRPDPADPLDACHYDGYAVAAGGLLGVEVLRPTHGRFADPSWSAYWKACERRTADAGVRFVVFGDDEDVDYVAVAHVDSVHETDYGPAALTLPASSGVPMKDSTEWDQLRAFCDKVEIPWREPRWFVAVRCCA